MIQTLGSEESHGPILLLWSAMHMFGGEVSDFGMARKYGNGAIQLHTFHYLYSLLKSEPFTDENSVSFVRFYTLVFRRGVLCYVVRLSLSEP
jgi:hypothetical protein